MRSSSGFSPVLDIDAADGGRVSLLVLAATGLALVAITLGHLPGPVAAAAMAIITAGGLRAAWRARPGAAGAVACLRFASDGRVAVAGQGGRAAAETDGVIDGWWRLPGVAVGLRVLPPAGAPVMVLLFRDRLPPADWRRLAAHLRLGRPGDWRPARGDFT